MTQLINIKKDQLKLKLDQILKQIEDIPIDFTNRKNIERILAFLDYCYGIEHIREKVINSDKLTYSLIECLSEINYEQLDSFESLYDLWRICIKYFNIPTLSKQPYFDKLKKVVWSKCCLIHKDEFIRISHLRQFIFSSPDKSAIVDAIGKQYNLSFKVDLTHLSESESDDILAVAFFLRMKMVNLAMTFFNLILNSEGNGEGKTTLYIEMNHMHENTSMMTGTDHHLNFSLLVPVLDLLYAKPERFKLWDFTYTLSESIYLMQKLIVYTCISNQASKILYGYLNKLLEIDISIKRKNGWPVSYFGEDEPRWKLGKPGNFLKNVFHALEILPISDTADYSIVCIVQKVFELYTLDKNASQIFDTVLYESFLVVLSRVEVQMMDLAFVDLVFQQFEQQKTKYPSNTNTMFQLVFLKRLVIYCYEENDIFDKPSVAAYYNSFFDKFDEYLSMIAINKLHAKMRKIEEHKTVLSAHSIKNGKTIKILEEQIKKLAEEDDKLRGTASL